MTNMPQWRRATIPPSVLRRLAPLGLVTVLAMSGVVVTYLLVWEPATTRLEQAELAYQTAKQNQEQLARTRALQEKSYMASRDVEARWNNLPTHDDFSSFAMAISEMGRREHIGIPGMAYHVEKIEGELPTKATLTFKATGHYGAIYRFIHRLETADPYLVIESLDAARLDHVDRMSSALLVFNVKVATFLRPSPGGKQVS